LASLGLDENNNADVATFFAWWSEALMLGNVVDDLVVHHAGHGGERSRGASRLLDEPDAVWTLTKDADVNTGEDDIYGAASPTRYLSAYGRDVELSPEALDFDIDTRRLTLTGKGRAAMKADKESDAIAAVFKDGMPRSVNRIVKDCSIHRTKAWDLVTAMTKTGELTKAGSTENGYPLWLPSDMFEVS